MGTIKLFVQQQCSRCPQAKQIGSELKQQGFQVEEFDVETPDGMAEASFYSIKATPAFIIEDEQENTIADFRGQMPTVEQIKELMGTGASIH
jgi:thioredoxin-related protein